MSSNTTLTIRLGRHTGVALSLFFFCLDASAQESIRARFEPSSKIESSGPILAQPLLNKLESVELDQGQASLDELPLSQIQNLLGERPVEQVGRNRSARDAEL
jgi:hypothetical protein